MPKVNLLRDREAELAESCRKIIRKQMVERNIDSQTELARKLNIPAQTISYKMTNGRWTLADVRALDRVLRFTDAQLAGLGRWQ